MNEAETYRAMADAVAVLKLSNPFSRQQAVAVKLQDAMDSMANDYNDRTDGDLPKEAAAL